jgi:hypothetical protein
MSCFAKNKINQIHVLLLVVKFELGIIQEQLVFVHIILAIVLPHGVYFISLKLCQHLFNPRIQACGHHGGHYFNREVQWGCLSCHMWAELLLQHIIVFISLNLEG